MAIPAEQNPILDTTGEFAAVGQSGQVWFLAGSFGSDPVSRTVTVPSGKSLFVPIFNSLWWAPDDLDDAAWLAGELGLDPEQMTAEELIELIATYQVAFATSMTVCIDGVAVRNPEQYRAQSESFPLIDTDLLDGLGAEISQPNSAVGAGYWLMLAPLPVGKHTIQFAVESQNPIFGDFSLDISYDLTVVPKGRR